MPAIPNLLLWDFNHETLRGKQYLKDLDFIKEHTDFNMLFLTSRVGTNLMDKQQCVPAIAELVARAHELDLKIGLHINCKPGFYNTPVNAAGAPEIDQVQLFNVGIENAEGMVCPAELQADENGFASYVHRARWVRQKLQPLRAELLRVYAFRKTAEGFYDPDSLADVTESVRVVEVRTNGIEIEIDAGKEHAGKTLFVLIAQYYNFMALPRASWKELKTIMDRYADIPLDGVMMDEYGYMLLNTSGIEKGSEEPFRGHFYNEGLRRFYEERGVNLVRTFFDMRYAPQNAEGVRIRAINRYFDLLRRPPLENEWKVAEHARKLWGDDVFLSCHNTFHNNLEGDEIWHTGSNWWSLPRQYGHTDENITMAVRMGVMLAAGEPLEIDMFYSKHPELHYRHMAEGAPFGSREFHHAYNDIVWSCDFSNLEFLKNIRHMEAQINRLNGFQTEFPRLDLLIIYGTAAQHNWYPDESARSVWDIDGTLHIQRTCDEIWNAGYRCALIPDTALEEGKLKLEGDCIVYNGYAFRHCLFLYPKYAKKEVYALLNAAGKAGVNIAAVGRCDIDFDAEPAQLTIPSYPSFDLDILKNIGCPTSAIPGGCVLRDGSFILVSEGGLLRGEETAFDFVVDGVAYSGQHTGLLAYRKGQPAITTPGSVLCADGTEIH